MELNFEIDAIKPKVAGNASDKYSRLFYKWVKKNWKRAGFKVFCTQRNICDGSFWQFDNDAQRADIYIGSMPHDNEIWGQCVPKILVGAKGIFSIPVRNKEYLLDISEWFWAEYLSRGRCIFDPEHNRSFLFDDDRYAVDAGGKKRQCVWCGQDQVLRKQKITIEKEVWEKE